MTQAYHVRRRRTSANSPDSVSRDLAGRESLTLRIASLEADIARAIALGDPYWRDRLASSLAVLRLANDGGAGVAA